MLHNFTLLTEAGLLRSAYLLVTHGSRDIRPQIEIDQLRAQVEQRLSVPVGAAVLECAPTPLHEQIEEFSRQHQTVSQIQIVPLFLLPGVHVTQDIPEQIAIAQSRIDAELQVLSYLGSYTGMANVLASRLTPSDAQILLAHGSRRSGGNAAIEKIATEIETVPAYWSVEPKLETRLLELEQQGYQEIAILLYFLFSGGITDAIAQLVKELSEQYPALTLQLLSPFDFCEELVNVIVEFVTSQTSAELPTRSH